MASPRRRLPTNAEGPFYVDDSCIDCATCRWLAPATFSYAAGASRVHAQPQAPEEERAALRAVLACPTASIGAVGRSAREAAADFPLPVEAEVSHCGFHHEESFGATSYLIERPGGNVLVDSPRFARPLVRRLEERGGVRWMFLTHRDDVADHARFAAHFGCERVLHAGDARGVGPVERLIEGEAPVALAEDLLVLPTPGHTRGSACLLYRERFLFTGDTLAWSPSRGHLYAFADACWYDWGALRRSIAGLRGYRFAWVLPGHGWRARVDPGKAASELDTCLEWMDRQR